MRSGDDYRQDFAGFGLGGLVEAFISSVDVGVRKPDPRIFLTALHLLRCPPQAAVMVGDSEFNDVAPAKQLGARTIRVAIETPPTPSEADAVATDLRQVEDLLVAWRSG